MYTRILNKHNLLIKFLFVIIWFFLIFRITTHINLHTNILQLNLKRLFFSLADFSSIIIATGLLIYFLFYFKIYKKNSITAILLIYPIIGFTSYFFFGIKNQYQDSIIWHHFITLISAFLFFTIIENKKIFDYQFKELLLKIILLVTLLYFLIYFLPTLIVGLHSKQDVRITQKIVFSIFNNQFYIEQNINGSTRICIVLLITSLIFFKKFIFNREIIANLFFLIALLLISFIFIMQSRLNIISGSIFSFFLLLSIKNLSLKKKLIYFSIILIFPLFISNIYLKQKSRFTDHVTYVDYTKIFQGQSNSYTNYFNSTSKIDYDFEQNNIIKIINENNKSIKNLSHKNFQILNNFIIKENKIPYFNHSQPLHLAKAFLVLHGDAMLSECSVNLNYFDRLLTGRICGWEILFKDIKNNNLFFGKSFFYDQLYLKYTEKTSSNSWMNILYNTGIFSLLVYLIFIFVFLSIFFKIKNINHENIYISISHYLFIYFLTRSLFEDTLAFVSLDFLLFFISTSIIKETKLKNI